jgi:hypothetical protein
MTTGRIPSRSGKSADRSAGLATDVPEALTRRPLINGTLFIGDAIPLLLDAWRYGKKRKTIHSPGAVLPLAMPLRPKRT